MFVTGYMTKSPITVSPDTPIPDARAILLENGFRHLPVTDQERHLLGMVTDRDIRSAYPSSVLPNNERNQMLKRVSSSPVGSIMSTRLSFLNLRSTLDDALILLEKQNVGALPVVDDSNKVVGILSIRDLMKAYRELFGLNEKGSALISIIDQGPDTMMKVIKVLEQTGVPFTRILLATRQTKEQDIRKIIYIRVQSANLPAIKSSLKEAGIFLLS